MYKGFRAGESGYLINKGIFSLNEFKYYITNKVTNKESLKIPIQKIVKTIGWLQQVKI